MSRKEDDGHHLLLGLIEMAVLTPQRRSGRQRVPNKKYTNDAFEGLEIFSSDSEVEQILQEEYDSRDEDFPEDQVAVESDDLDEENGSTPENVSDGSAIATPVEDNGDAHSDVDLDEDTVEPVFSDRFVPKQPRFSKLQAIRRDADVHSRGMPENPLGTNRSQMPSRVRILAGSGDEDVSQVVRSRDQWAADPTLPSRKRMCRHFSHTDEKRHLEATVGWDWYYKLGGRERFAETQRSKLLDPLLGMKYIPRIDHNSHPFLMGPYGRQTLFSLASCQTLGLSEAWNGTTAASEKQDLDNNDSDRKRQRHGWMLNAGAGVKCLDWASNCENDTQYLALATISPNDSRFQGTTEEAPAFTPELPTPSCVQIWAFTVDGIRQPKLQVVLCTEWGEVKQLKWCPVPRGSPLSEKANHRGLLAGIWGDGYVRVVEVCLASREQILETTYEKLDFAVFAARPRDTLSTCVTWLSATDIAVGHSNGYLAVYNIDPPNQQSFAGNGSPKETHDTGSDPSHSHFNSFGTQDTEPVPKPWLYMPVHPTYILTILSSYPSHPALIITTSLSGYYRLTSLLAPQTDYVLSIRTRWPSSSLTYSDALLGALGPEESSQTIRLWGLRCFYTSAGVSNVGSSIGPGQGVIDSGKCHSSVAYGGTDGSVIVTNPIRRILGKKGIGLQQCIFKHDWVRKPSNGDGNDQAGERHGMSRILEGFKLEKVDMSVKGGKKFRESEMITIYEPETAVTALAWDPNLVCGGWLAVGWGSGLVRVQDVAV